MRKFTLLVVAALIAATSTFAQQGRQSQNNRQQAPALDRQQVAQVLNQQPHSQKSQRAVQLGGLQQAASTQALARRNAEGIADTPAGTLHETMIAAFSGLAYNWLFGYMDISTDASPASLVEGADGNLYIKGLTPSFYGEAYWVKAEPTGEANRYVIHRQVAGEYPNYDEIDYISRLVYDEEAGDFVEADDTDLFLTYADGVLTLDPAEIDESGLPDYAYGLVNDYWGDFAPDASYGYYWNLSLSELAEEITELPADATVETLVLQHQEGGKEVQVAFVGDKVYVQSYSYVPGWYVGTVSGDKVTFKSGQFLGLDTYYNSYEWLIAGHIYEAYDEEYDEYYTAADIVDEVVFDYDAATKTLTAPEDAALFINGAKDRIYYAERYLSPKFYVFDEVPAVPADPIIDNFWDYDDYYENAELDFTIPQLDADGNYINVSKLSYSLFVDNELFEFTPDEYEDLAEPITEVPVGTSPDYYINLNWLCIFFQPAENIGLQTIYRGADVEMRSNIVYYDVNTQEVYTEPYVNPVTAVKGVSTQQQASVVYYDAAGRRVQANAKGLLLKTVTTADGSQKTVKVIR